MLRAFGGFEKGTTYYLNNTAFLVKMALLGLILLLELWPMVVMTRWRAQQRHGVAVELGSARGVARISYIEAGLVVAMVLAATAMARGLGA